MSFVELRVIAIGHHSCALV